MYLRAGHAPLNKHLHRIRKVADPFCPYCPDAEETVHHLFLACPQYQRDRRTLLDTLGRQASSIPFLLTDPSAAPPLVKFLNATGRLKATPGEIPLPRIITN
ncbi:hypothetical protein BDR04DRAFT_1093208 [Suillus decipiens]|nr:hypothetical protein BDR04DRAFT_1093208 [Suillus decipiens]